MVTTTLVKRVNRPDNQIIRLFLLQSMHDYKQVSTLLLLNGIVLLSVVGYMLYYSGCSRPSLALQSVTYVPSTLQSHYLITMLMCIFTFYLIYLPTGAYMHIYPKVHYHVFYIMGGNYYLIYFLSIFHTFSRQSYMHTLTYLLIGCVFAQLATPRNGLAIAIPELTAGMFMMCCSPH